MTGLGLTLAAIVAHRWRLVLLGQRSKRPIGVAWEITDDRVVIGRHVRKGGNIGVVCGPESRLAVLDFDDLDAARAMMRSLGRIPPTVLTGSRKAHVYVRYEQGLPAKLRWKGRCVGEIQRGGAGPAGRRLLQQVVCPPSVHPKTGSRYAWLCDPRQPVPALPEAWRTFLVPPRPANGLVGGRLRQPRGPSVAALLAQAATLPGARLRSYGVKFQCPCCASDGHDRSRDNALVMTDGRFGCAYAAGEDEEARRHRRAIAAALGIGSRPWWAR